MSKSGYPTAVKPKTFDAGTLYPDEVKMFRPLNTEPKELLGYLRTGGCTAGCGACCEAMVLPLAADFNKLLHAIHHPRFLSIEHNRIQIPIDPVVATRPGYDDWQYWMTLHDVFLFKVEDRLTADLPLAPKRECLSFPDLDGWTSWLEEHDITIVDRAGQTLLAYLPIACEKLEDGMCTVFGTDERPQMCAPYPEHPTDVEGIDFCTYDFKPIYQNDVIPLAPAKSASKPAKKRKKRRKR